MITRGYRSIWICLISLSFLTPSASLGQEVVALKFCDPKADLEKQFNPARVTLDIRELAKHMGADAGTVTALLETLHGLNGDVPARLNAAAELKTWATQGSGPFAVTRAVLRRAEIAEAGLNAIASENSKSDSILLFNELLQRLTVEVEFAWRDVYSWRAREIIETLRQDAPVIHDAVLPVISKHYLASNFQLVMSEPMAKKVVDKPETESDCVNECVLGARVTGFQTTHVSPDADIRPSSHRASWTVIGNGQVDANTRGTQGPVTVCTDGDHCFRATLDMSMAGPGVMFSPPGFYANANNRLAGVSTRFDRVPIVRGLVRSIARRQVAQKKAQTEAIAESKIRERALPVFRDKAQEPFTELNKILLQTSEFRTVYLGREPDFQTWSSGSHLYVNTRTHSVDGFAASPVPVNWHPDSGMVVHIHESLLNAVVDGFETYIESLANCFLNTLREKHPDLDVSTDEIIAALRKLRDLPLEDIFPTSSASMNNAAREGIDALITLLEQNPGLVEIGWRAVRNVNFCFRECDGLRVRLENGAVVLTRPYDPKNNELPEGLTIPLEARDGKIRIAADTVENSLNGLGERIPHVYRLAILNLLAEKNIDFETLRSKLLGSLKHKLSHDTRLGLIVLTPEHLEVSIRQMHIDDGWLSLDLDGRVRTRQETEREINRRRKLKARYGKERQTVDECGHPIKPHPCLKPGTDCGCE